MSEGLEVQNPIKPAMISCDEIYGHLNEDECQNAIEKLPNDISSDITYDPPSGRYLYPRFSRTMADPRFKLPLIQGAGECQVQISLAFGSQSNSTLWSIIRRQASLIVQDCVRRRNGIGGSSIAGREGEIRISLIQEPPPPERIPFEVSSGMKRDFFNGRSFMVVVSGRGFEGAHSTACQNTLSLVRQNNSRLDELSSKVSALRGVTVNIYDNARSQDVLDNSSEVFSSMSSNLKGSAQRLGRMAQSGNKVAILKLAGIIVAIVVVLWWGLHWAFGS